MGCQRLGAKEGLRNSQKAMEEFRGAGWYRKRAVNVGSGAVGTVRGGFVTKVSGMEGGLSMVAGDLGGSGRHQWSTGSVGTWSGRVLVFDIPTKGPNIVLSEELARHQTPITDIATEPAQGQVSGSPLPVPVNLRAFHTLRKQGTWVQALALPPSHCMTLGKLVHFAKF